MDFTIGTAVIAVGVLIFIFGVLFTRHSNGFGKLLLGIVIAAAGAGVGGIGYTMDQRTEVDYTVVEVTPVTARDDGNTYRVELSYGDGAETIIYIDEKYKDKFAKGNTITMMKKDLKIYEKDVTG
ncbi:MAG TPA: hypothetical protein DCO72_02305 [Ruminococcus sp.]|nr:hypothetical protein [Ruminococcus sp.]